MTKIDMLNEMRQKLGEMHTLLTRAGLSDFLSIVADADKLSAKLITAGHKWLEKIYITEFAAANKIWVLLPPELWKRYEVWGEFDDHRESKMLAEALIVLKKAVQNTHRPGFFKKSIVTKLLKKKVKRETKKGT